LFGEAEKEREEERKDRGRRKGKEKGRKEGGREARRGKKVFDVVARQPNTNNLRQMSPG